MNRRTFTLSSLALAACGGGGSDIGIPISTSGKIIRIISDSTGVGIALGPSGYFIVDRPWPSYISIPGFTVVNSSVGGMAMKDVSFVNNAPYAVAIIGLCINDAFQYPADVYAAYLREAVVMLRSVGTLVILQTPNPTYEPRVTAFAQVMRDVAAELSVPLIDQDKHLREVYSDLSFAGDRMHPSQPGYAVMGVYADSMLREILT